ncbi:MAG: hypothetical protein KDA85_17190, partial [Planctomycetaceae bacterium]|nr:hypothetical protein [Planctomycetaceae bacterium]
MATSEQEPKFREFEIRLQKLEAVLQKTLENDAIATLAAVKKLQSTTVYSVVEDNLFQKLV